jgi:hypothetical protein
MTHNAAPLLTMDRNQPRQNTIRDRGCRLPMSLGRSVFRDSGGHARSRLTLPILTTSSGLDSGAALNASTVMPGARLASEHNCARCSAASAPPVVAGDPHPDWRRLRVLWSGEDFSFQVVWAGLRATPHTHLQAATSRVRTPQPEGAQTAASDDGCWRCGTHARTSVKQANDRRSQARQARAVNVSVLKCVGGSMNSHIEMTLRKEVVR